MDQHRRQVMFILTIHEVDISTYELLSMEGNPKVFTTQKAALYFGCKVARMMSDAGRREYTFQIAEQLQPIEWEEPDEVHIEEDEDDE